MTITLEMAMLWSMSIVSKLVSKIKVVGDDWAPQSTAPKQKLSIGWTTDTYVRMERTGEGGEEGGGKGEVCPA